MQIDVVKAFLEDPAIQKKYGITAGQVAQMTLSTPFSGEAGIFVDLVRRMVKELEDQNTTTNAAAQRLNAHLENTLR